jgi:hypothetical protein
MNIENGHCSSATSVANWQSFYTVSMKGEKHLATKSYTHQNSYENYQFLAYWIDSCWLTSKL